MVADPNAYAGNPYGAPPPQQAYGAPQQAYGAAQQQAYGAPQQQQAYGAPQQQAYGAPQQQAYGAPQQQAYGAPQQQAYAPPPDQGQGGYGGAAYGAPQPAYGAPPPPGVMPYGGPPGAAMQPVGGAAMQAMAGGLIGGMLVGGDKPTVRNPMKILLVPYGLFAGGIVVSILFTIIAMAAGSGIIGMLGSLLSLVCFVGGAALMLLALIKMVNEVKSVTRNVAFAWWPIFVPLYNYYWLWIMLPQEVTNAKRTVGLQQPARGIVLYIFIAPYALAADINEIAARTG